MIVEDGTPPDEGLEQPAAAAEGAEGAEGADSGAAHGPNGDREGDGGEAVSVVP